jgi:hypothetical protein
MRPRSDWVPDGRQLPRRSMSGADEDSTNRVPPFAGPGRTMRRLGQAATTLR